MRNIKTILALGILVAILPYTGFPISWKSYSILFLGSLIAVLAFRVLLKERNKISDVEQNIKELQTEEIDTTIAKKEILSENSSDA